MSVAIAVQNPKARSRLPVDRGGTQRDIGARLEMCLQQLSVIHAVELIAAQEAIADRDVHQTIFAAQGHRRLSALLGQEKRRVPAPPPGVIWEIILHFFLAGKLRGRRLQEVRVQMLTFGHLNSSGGRPLAEGPN